MAVISDGNTYKIPKGVVYSFPVNFKGKGEWEIVQGLHIDEFSRKKMDYSAQELLEERKLALGF